MEKAANEGIKLPISNSDRGECAEMFHKSAQLYRNNEQPDKAASLLLKAAAANQDIDIKQSVAYIGEACTVLEEDNRGLFSRDTFINGVAFLLKLNRYEDAIAIMRRHNKICEVLMSTFGNDLYKNLLSILVIRLHIGDYETAVNEYKEFINIQDFSTSDEFNCAYELMLALSQGSNEQLAKCTSKQMFTLLNNQIARLARRLTQFDSDKIASFLAKGIKITDTLEDFIEEKDDAKTLQKLPDGQLDFQSDLNTETKEKPQETQTTSSESPPSAQSGKDNPVKSNGLDFT